MRDKTMHVKVRDSYSDKIFDGINIVVMLLLLIIFVWPLWFVVIASVSNPNEVWNGNVILLPKDFTLMAYEELMKYKMIWTGYRNTIFYTVVGTFVNLVMTVCAAYPQVLINVEVPHSGGVKEKIMASQELEDAVKREEAALNGEGRVLVRASGTEALIRVMVEAKTNEIAKKTADSLVSLIKSLKF